MLPTKEGQIVKFHTPMEGEDPNQLYVVLEIKIDGYRDRVDIKPLGSGFSFPVINTVPLGDLKVVEVNTQDLIGHTVSIRKNDSTEINGKVIDVDIDKIYLDLIKTVSGVETNVRLTVQDDKGVKHEGTLVVR